MKKLLFLILTMFLLSCEKQDVYCWKCTTTLNDEVISTITTCYMTEEDVLDFQDGIQAQATACAKQPCKTVCIKNQ